MFNMGDMGSMMKRAQKLQEDLKQAQDEIKSYECTGEAGAGLVKVTINGEHQTVRVEIDPAVFSDEKEICEDLIVAAANDANRRLQEKSNERMEQLTAGMGLPPGMKLPF